MRITFFIIIIFLLSTLSSNQLTGQVDSLSKGKKLLLKGIEQNKGGQIDSSIHTFKQAVIEFKNEENSILLAEAYIELYSLHFLTRNLSEAEKVMLKLKTLFSKHISPKEQIYAELANDIGHYHFTRGNLHTALKYFNIAYANNPHDRVKSTIMDNRASMFALLGDRAKAIRMRREAIDTLLSVSIEAAKSFPIKIEERLPHMYYNLANNYKENNQLDSAKHYYLKSKEIINSTGNTTSLRQRKSLANNLTQLTKIAFDENEVSLAEKYIREWETIYSNFKEYTYKIHHLYIQKSRYFEEINDKEKALFYLKKAKQFTKEQYAIYARHSFLSEPYRVSAEFHMRSKQYKKALDEIKIAIELISLGIRNEQGNKFISNLQGIKFLSLKAQLENTLFSKNDEIKYLKDCNKTYELLSDIILKMRTNVQSQASELHWSQRLTKIYQSAVKNAVTLYQKTNDQAYLEQAFYYSECNKAATLAEKVSYEKTLKSILPEEKWKALQDLRIDITFYQKQINIARQKTEQDSTKITEWTQIIEDLENKYKAVEKDIEENYPEYANAVKAFNPSTVEEIRNDFLQENSALVEYFSMEDSWYIFTLTKDDLTVEEVKKEETFDTAFDRLIEQISQQPKSSTYLQDLNDFTNDSHVLYELLLAQPLQDLANTVNSLMIIPDEELTYFPFELLLTKKPEKEVTSYSASVMPYLFNDYNISYGFSATVVNLTHQNEQQIKTGKPAIFAPAFSKEYIAENRSCHEDNLSYLQCNATEGERINDLISSDIFTGDLASIQQFREAASNAPILHLATHACVDEENEKGNKIFFADTYLTNEDLNTMGVNADLVVLSACDTGLGKLIQGEGLMSLSRGFLCAGTSSTVMSLWSVDDCATSDLMVNFYQELKNGNNKSIALKNAKLNYLNQADKLHQHPYFWAPFVLSGNVEPIETISASSSLLYFGIGAVALLLAFFGYWKIKN